MSELKDKIKDAVGSIANAEYEGDIIGLGCFYVNKKGEVKNILACDNSMLLSMIGGSELLKLLIINNIQIRKP